MKIVGHNKQIDFLRKSLSGGRVSQSYIFSGPSGIGKFSIAKSFAKSLVEGRSDIDFDAEDGNILASNLIVVEPLRVTVKGVLRERGIKIADVREAQKKLSIFPYSGKFNILIIDGASRMNVSAQNALLKTLEEPNSSSVIILIVSDENKILSTIRSRCQTVRFGVLSIKELEKGLVEKFGGRRDQEALFSMGRFGLAVELKNDPELLLRRKGEYEDFKKIFSMGIFEKMSLAEEYAKNVSNVLAVMDYWVWFLRVWGYKSTNDFRKLGYVYEMIDRVEKGKKKIQESNANTRLILENLLIGIK